MTKTPQTIDPAALRNLIAAAKAIVFACEIGSIGCGNEFKVLQASIEVAEGRPWSRIRPARKTKAQVAS